MRRGVTIARVCLGGAVCGCFAGGLAGGVLGAAVGVLRGNVALGLDGALVVGGLGGLVGTVWSVVLAVRDAGTASRPPLPIDRPVATPRAAEPPHDEVDRGGRPVLVAGSSFRKG